MTLLGLAVGRGSTPLDDRFQDLGQTHRLSGRLLVLTDDRVTLTLWAILGAIVVFRQRWRLTAVVAAVVATVLGVLGQGVSYHYFTDAVGAVFLGTTVLCLAAWAAGLDRCQPRCDVGHRSG